MIGAFHFLRPYWLLTLIPLIFITIWLIRKKPGLQAWHAVCDPHLLKRLLQMKSSHNRLAALSFLLLSMFFLIVSLAGPTWSKNPVPTFKQALPRVVILDLSQSMLTNDLKPNRLKRAQYKLHDLFRLSESDLYGLIVYTSEPFIVSPITEDAKTIETLLPMLSPEIMPVHGQNLESAMREGAKLIHQAGYPKGDLLILTGTAPSNIAVGEAKILMQQGIHTSIMPLLKGTDKNPLFTRLAHAGGGELLAFNNTPKDMQAWLEVTRRRDKFQSNLNNDIPIWKDEGRWFLIPALILLLPVFRRGWVQRLMI